MITPLLHVLGQQQMITKLCEGMNKVYLHLVHPKSFPTLQVLLEFKLEY